MPSPLITPPSTPGLDIGDLDRRGRRPQDLRPDPEPPAADVGRPADGSDRPDKPLREKKI